MSYPGPSDNDRPKNDFPLAELMVSGCFSVLVFSSVASAEEKVFTYYYGALSGLLLYVIVRGVPVMP